MQRVMHGKSPCHGQTMENTQQRFFAEDEAGNLSHLCSMLFVIAGHELQAAVVLHEMSAQVDGENRRYSTEFVDHQFMGIVQEGGYQIESVVCSRDHI